jgi:hypothetical protein
MEAVATVTRSNPTVTTRGESMGAARDGGLSSPWMLTTMTYNSCMGCWQPRLARDRGDGNREQGE